MKSTDDCFLLQLIAKGDEYAFNLLFHRYYAALCRFSLVYVGDASIAEEIALDVFSHLWEVREEMVISSSIKGYLFRSVHNKSINFIRDNRHLVSIESVELLQGCGIETELEYEELRHVIESAVCSLPDRCREVYEKSRKDCLSNREIASLMSLSVRTVDAHIVAALKKIRVFVQKKYQ